jgi:hypothetical protein
MSLAPQTPKPPQPGQAEIVMKLPNRAILKGYEICLLRSEDGRYALGHFVGDTMNVDTAWIDAQTAVDLATRACCGDRAALEHPKALLMASLGLVGMVAEGQRALREAEAAAKGAQG